eukprot:2927577-Pleurochrysis_carterae.AAC.1
MRTPRTGVGIFAPARLVRTRPTAACADRERVGPPPYRLRLCPPWGTAYPQCDIRYHPRVVCYSR